MRIENDIEPGRSLWDVYESPLGTLTVVAGPLGATALHFPGRSGPLDERDRQPAALARATEQLEEYFAGERRSFELDLDPVGSPFLRRVWRQLQEIPYGTTITYTELAEAVGRPDILRGVAAAVGRNPLPIIVPCHRVVAADGGLTGYLGGLHRKRALLDLEQRTTLGFGPDVAWAYRQLTLT